MSYDKDQMIRDVLTDPEKLTKFANTLREPLRTARDYKSVARELFMVEEAVQNGVTYWPTDVDAVAVQLGTDGQTIKSYSGYTNIPAVWTKIQGHIAIPVTQIATVTYDIVQRSIDKLRSKVNMEEDAYAIKMLNALIDKNVADNRFTMEILATGSNGKIAPADVSNAIGIIEDQTNDKASVILINPKNVSAIRTWGRDIYDFTTQRELLQKGYIGTIYGVQVIQTPMCPVNRTYVLGQKNLLGRMPILSDLTVVPVPNMVNIEIGFVIYEVLGLLLYNPAALCYIKHS